MTPQEAFLFFNVPEGDEPEDFFQTQLFEYKRFFISKVPIKKVFLAKVEKLLKLQKAYEILHAVEMEKITIAFERVCFEGNWLNDFNLLHIERSRIKQLLFVQTEAMGILNVIDKWLQLEDDYMALYAIWSESDIDKTVLVSQEPDQMSLLGGLEEEAQRIELSPTELLRNRKDLPKLLQNELKRLTLLRQMNLEWEKK